MFSAIKALAWEIWQRGYKFVAIISGMVAICALTNHIAPDKAYLLKNFEAVYWLLMVGSLFLTFGIFHYAEYNRVKNWHGFPYRLFCLPVRTIVLVACPMLLGTLSVGLVYWAWAKLIFAPLSRSVSFWPAACVGAGMICYQAIVWGLAGFRITRIIVLALTGLLLANVAMIPLIDEIKLLPERNLYAIGSALLGFLAISGAVGGWYSVEQQRRGGGRGRGFLKAGFVGLIDMLPRRNRNFTSGAAAQLWFEWRRGGQMLPLCVGSLLVMIFIPLSWFTRSDHDSALWICGWAIALPLILAAVIGKTFGKPDLWSADFSVPTFLAIRPLASGEMVVTKMKAAALSVILTWILVLTFLGCYLPLWANTADLSELWRNLALVYGSLTLYTMFSLGIIAIIIVTWRSMVGSLWVGLSGNLRLFFGSAAIHALIAVFLVWSIVRLSLHFWTQLDQTLRHLEWIGWALVTLAALKFLLALRSWNAISADRTRKYLAAWWLGTICFILLMLTLDPPFPALRHVLILAAFLPVPLARLGLAPAALAKNRHRK